MIGRVVSTKMQNTAAVLVMGSRPHPIYKKAYLISKKYLVDDPIGVKMGDMVEILKIRPVSKRKHWRIIKVLGHREEEIITAKLKEEAAEAIEEVMPESPENSESSENQNGGSENQKSVGQSDVSEIPSSAQKVQKSTKKGGQARGAA